MFMIVSTYGSMTLADLWNMYISLSTTTIVSTVLSGISITTSRLCRPGSRVDPRGSAPRL
ncbi:hypothetical protein DPMN_048637 [Dreissena polymorpha]|uniref:Uncharacterized protein n=1 Tax=Dreissena polymorpha TaxID=45954 RepID=A0A9D4I333_DREPO|nr:hypothetical protein DPMN_048637 [Dreissena polymorpha]